MHEEENGVGIICRHVDHDNFVILVIDNLGYYKIQKYQNGEWASLIEWQQTDRVHSSNNINHITAVCDRNTLALYVNGHFLDSVVDNDPVSGGIGLIAESYSEMGVDAFFDNFYAYEP